MVDASSPESLERGFLNIAEVCKQERSVNVVKRCLSNTTEPWIVILDNADDPWLDVSRYFPAGNRGIILITTRNPECKVHATVGSWELGAMTTDEAITLILKTAGVEDLSDTSIRKTAETVVATLGCLALAIIQAGAVIQKRLCSMEEYCGVYSRRRRELLSQRAVQGEDEYPYTVYTTWEVSRKMIEQMSNEVGRDALELLNVFSFFHHDGISEEIFRRSWEKMQRGMSSGWMLSHQVDIVLRQLDQEWEPYPLRVAFSLLQSFSLINRDKDNLIFIHPLVHTWARDRLSASGQETIWSQATSTVALSVPSSLHTADNQYRMFLMPHIDACLGDRIDKIFQLHNAGHDCQVIAANFGRVYGDAGRRQAAIYITERINEINLSTLGPEHEETLMSMSNLAIYYSEMGRQREALEMTESVLEVKKKNLGEEHEETLESLHSIGCEYHALGEPHKALQAFEKVVKARQRTLGEEDPSTLIAMSNLAMSYSHVGRKEDALQLTEQVVRANKEIWGEENPETLRDMRSLAHRYNEVDRQEEALQLLEQVVDAFKKTLGEEHPDTLRSMYTLASSYFDMGQTQEALELAERQTKASSRVLGQEDPKTIQSAHSLARIYAGVGQQQKSMQLVRTCLAMCLPFMVLGLVDKTRLGRKRGCLQS